MARSGSTTRAPANSRGRSQRTPKKQAEELPKTRRIPRNPQAPAVPVTTPYESSVARGFRSVANATGAVFRLFPNEPVHPDDRKDGVPFVLFVLAVAGIVIEWFNYGVT
jgi:hypothetical protein